MSDLQKLLKKLGIKEPKVKGAGIVIKKDKEKKDIKTSSQIE